MLMAYAYDETLVRGPSPPGLAPPRRAGTLDLLV